MSFEEHDHILSLTSHLPHAIAYNIVKTAINNENTDSKSSSNNQSILGILLLAVGGAVLSWVMPCVYPMIPIIISFFSKMSQEKHVGKNTIALIYGLGISGTFVIIGLIVGLLSWGIEDVAAQARNANIGNFIATNPWINLFLGILFFLRGYSLA